MIQCPVIKKGPGPEGLYLVIFIFVNIFFIHAVPNQSN